MNPAAVVFDCDGVLVDSEPHSVAAWLEVLSGLGHPATRPDVAACTGVGFGATYAALAIIASLPPEGVVWPLLLASLEASFRGGLKLFSDAVGVLDACIAAGVPVAVASASPRQRLDLTLEVAGLSTRFGVSVAGDEVPNGKPAPDVYLAAAARLGVDPAACRAVEDSPAGVTAARSAGMDVVAVARSGADAAALAGAGAWVVAMLTVGDVGL